MSMLAFIHVAKTAGSTMDRILGNSYGGAYCHAEHWTDLLPSGDRNGSYTVPKYDAEQFRRLKRLCPWMRCVGGHAVTLWSGLEKVQPTRFFAFLREPVARGASHYQYHLRHDADPLDWDDWVEWEVHKNHQLKMFSRSVDVQEAIENIERSGAFVGLMEHFDESLLLLQRLAAPGLKLGYQRSNTARDNEVADKLLGDPVTRGQLEEMYAGDQLLYDHVKQRLFPGYREQYGPDLAADLAAFPGGPKQGFGRGRLIVHRVMRRFWIEPWGRYYRRRG
jgi:hypothetical protein